MEQLQNFRSAMRLDPVKVPEELKPKPPGTTLGPEKIKVLNLDKYPKYEYSETLLGDVRPVSPFGPRKLWASPEITES